MRDNIVKLGGRKLKVVSIDLEWGGKHRSRGDIVLSRPLIPNKALEIFFVRRCSGC